MSSLFMPPLCSSLSLETSLMFEIFIYSIYLDSCFLLHIFPRGILLTGFLFLCSLVFIFHTFFRVSWEDMHVLFLQCFAKCTILWHMKHIITIFPFEMLVSYFFLDLDLLLWFYNHHACDQTSDNNDNIHIMYVWRIFDFSAWSYSFLFHDF